MGSECNFQSFFLGGFECSTHRHRNGRRLDLTAATGHDRWCEADYRRLREAGIATTRDGVRWYLVEAEPRRYDFSSLLPMLRAARRTGMQVIWDLFHYGWPDDLDLLGAEFLDRFSAFAREVARVVSNESEADPYFTPVNEASFFAWGAGEAGILNPFATGRGNELKRLLVQANIAAIDAIRSIAPQARFVQVDPIINVVTSPEMTVDQKEKAEGYNRSQMDGWEMVSGRLAPELGGSRRYLDIIGVNYYVHNQWVHGGKFIEPDDNRYRPLHDLLGEVYQRYRRPLFLAETGIEDDRRVDWLRYVCDEVAMALERGVPVEGICLYPILDYPGWEDERHCCTGLWDYCDEQGYRELCRPFADELARQQGRMERVLAASLVER